MELCYDRISPRFSWTPLQPCGSLFCLRRRRRRRSKDSATLPWSGKRLGLCVRNDRDVNKASTVIEETQTFMLQETLGKSLLREYTVDENDKLIYEETRKEPVSYVSNTITSPLDFMSPSRLPQVMKDFFLPTDFPDSVSHDYLRYMLWQFPTNVTGWACSTLVTSSLLKAVGVDTWAGTTIAATAAIKWVSKDGLGAFGRLFIGGRFGRVFDDDPKQWRMYAELIGSFGSIFELLTPVKPEWFLPLASLGRLTKAVGRGLKDPSFKVIQNHFAISGNMGEVSAKEEVWAVVAELLGIALGVALLSSPDILTSYSVLVWTWALIRPIHLWFRYQSLASLQFPTINFKRAFIMAKMHITCSSVPGVPECNNMENIIFPWQFSRPYLQLGCSLGDALSGEIFMSEVTALLDLYSNELHVLVLDSTEMQKVNIKILFKEGATSETILRSIWQAEWIMASIESQEDFLSSMHKKEKASRLSNQMTILAKSLCELESKYREFVCKMEEAGWDTSILVLRIPKDVPYLVVSTPSRSSEVKKT